MGDTPIQKHDEDESVWCSRKNQAGIRAVGTSRGVRAWLRLPAGQDSCVPCSRDLFQAFYGLAGAEAQTAQNAPGSDHQGHLSTQDMAQDLRSSRCFRRYEGYAHTLNRDYLHTSDAQIWRCEGMRARLVCGLADFRKLPSTSTPPDETLLLLWEFCSRNINAKSKI
jgi:hypothetical protein